MPEPHTGPAWPNRRHLLAAGAGLLAGCTLQPDRDHHHAEAPRAEPLRRPVRTAWVFSSGGPAQQRAGGGAAFAQVGGVLPAQVHDAVAVTAEPLEVAFHGAAGFGKGKQQGVGKGLGQRLAGGCVWHGDGGLGVEHAVDEAGRRPGGGYGAGHAGGVLPVGQGERERVQVQPLHAQVQV